MLTTRIITALAVLFCCCAARGADEDLVKLLRSAPQVHSAAVPIKPTGDAVIVHIQDWHWVPYEYVLAEGGDADDYLDLLEEVEAVQAEQYALLKRLVKSGHKSIYREGLTPDVEPIFKMICRILWKARKENPDDVRELLRRPNVLSIGTPGRLLAEGLVEQVKAADSDASLKLTHPFDETGQLRDVPANSTEKREDLVIQRLLKAKGVRLLIFGGGHDFADNVKRLSRGQCGLIVVTTNRYRRAAKD